MGEEEGANRTHHSSPPIFLRANEMDNETLKNIIRPIESPRYEIDIHLQRLFKMLEDFGRDYGGLDLQPDFQRGHVWTPAQQQHFVENLLRGVISTGGLTIQFNCPNWNDHGYRGELPVGLQCLDGLQRITAIKAWLEGQVKPFGLSLADLEGSRFDPMRMSYRLRFALYDFQTRDALLGHYLDINSGGTPHSEAEIARVQALRDAACEAVLETAGAAVRIRP